MPHYFIVEYLHLLKPSTKVMFGNHSIYIGDKIYLATRENLKDPIDNGIWICTTFEHHVSLMSEFPDLKQLSIKNIKKWLLLPVDSETFMATAFKICDMILRGDPRFGVDIKK